MNGKPQTILELLRAITGWSNEEIIDAFGKDETGRTDGEGGRKKVGAR